MHSPISKKSLGFVCLYIASVTWIHILTRSDSTLNQLKPYLIARCETKYDDLKCKDMKVKVTGVWGGFYGRPNVRLLIQFPDDGIKEEKYYTLKISPIYGFHSVYGEFDKSLYYYTF